jgi:SAM-dependent methyltransferase
MANNSNPAQYQKDYFDTLYKEDQLTIFDKMRNSLIEKNVLKFKQSGNILDIGCGFGFMLEHFDKEKFNHFGIDISEHAVQKAKKRLPEGKFYTGDVHNGIDFAEKFDVILMINVVEHLQNPSLAIKQVYDKLNDGGILAIHLPVVNNGLNRLTYDKLYPDKTHVYKPKTKELNQMIDDIGFKTVFNAHCPFVPTFLWNALKPHQAFIGIYQKV